MQKNKCVHQKSNALCISSLQSVYGGSKRTKMQTRVKSESKITNTNNRNLLQGRRSMIEIFDSFDKCIESQQS